MIIGLTGMSGSGKTTACMLFREKGFKIADCDRIARETVAGKCLDEVNSFFTEQYKVSLLDKDGNLDRKKTAEIIFSGFEIKKMYEKIVFPYINYNIISECIGVTDVLLDAPTLFEAGLDILCDFTIAAVTEPKKAIKRIVKRDNIAEEFAEKRIAAQCRTNFKQCDFIAENNSTLENFYNSIGAILEKLH
jgi:dephospho-CoA kinase